METQPAVYILASGLNGAVYVGGTSDIGEGVRGHKGDQWAPTVILDSRLRGNDEVGCLTATLGQQWADHLDA